MFFKHLQAHTLAACINAQFGHVGDRDATVFRNHERLSFSGEAGHFDDRFSLRLRLKVYSFKMHFPGQVPSCASLLQRPTVEENPSICSGSPSALALKD